MEDAELSPAGVARLLGMSPATVSRYLSVEDGKRRDPSDQIIELLKHKLNEKHRSAGGGRPPAEVDNVKDAEAQKPEVRYPAAVRNATEQLRELHEEDPVAFETVANVIETFYGKKSKSSSKVKRAGRSLLSIGASKVRAASQARSPKPPADESTGEK